MDTPDTTVSNHPVLPSEICTTLGQIGVVRDVEAGEVVFEKGSAGEEMFVIEHGSIVLVFGDPGRVNKPLDPGQLFGELSLLAGGLKRSATAVATAPTRLRVIDRHAFDDLLRRAPQVSTNLLRLTCTYLLQSEQRLVAELAARNRELEHTLDFLRRTKEDLDSTELLALTDELTGLYNRRCLNRQSNKAIQQAAETRTPVALLIADIDHFKLINDRYGHLIGDQVLRYVARAVKDGLRQTDLPCRLGGDEFAVLVQDLEDSDALILAHRLPERVAAVRIPTTAGELQVTCSVGGTAYDTGESWDVFFDRADRSLYLAKESGRNCVAWNGEVVATGE